MQLVPPLQFEAQEVARQAGYVLREVVPLLTELLQQQQAEVRLRLLLGLFLRLLHRLLSAGMGALLAGLAVGAPGRDLLVMRSGAGSQDFSMQHPEPQLCRMPCSSIIMCYTGSGMGPQQPAGCPTFTTGC
jgi:hypothetical protein